MITILVLFLYDVYHFGERSRFRVSEKYKILRFRTEWLYL